MVKEAFDGNTLRKVRKWKTDGKDLKVFDSQCPGLAIRVYASGRASWSILTRDWKLTIADVAEFGVEDIPALRDLVFRARRMKADGRDPAPMIKTFADSRNLDGAEAEANAVSGVTERWEQARDQYLKELLETNSADTHRTYRSALGAVPRSVLEKDFAPLHGKPIVSITPDDIIKVRKSIRERGAAKGPNANMRQANASLTNIKSFFAWQMGREGNPVKTNPALNVPKEKRKDGGKKHKGVGVANEARALLQEEVGMLVLGLERHVNAAGRAAVMLQLLTGQRRMTVCEARKAAFVDHEKHGMIWRLEDKTRSWRSIPLPPLARQAVEVAELMARTDNDYLFPQQREGKDGKMDGHMNERTFSDVILRMRKPGGALKGIPFKVATHDMRKAFISTMSPTMHKYTVGERRLGEKDIEMITHEDEGREGSAWRIYNLDPYLDVKFAILSEWEHFVMEGLHKARLKMGIAA